MSKRVQSIVRALRRGDAGWKAQQEIVVELDRLSNEVEISKEYGRVCDSEARLAEQEISLLTAKIERLEGVLHSVWNTSSVALDEISYQVPRITMKAVRKALAEQKNTNDSGHPQNAMIDAIKRTSKHVDSMTPEEVQDYIDACDEANQKDSDNAC